MNGGVFGPRPLFEGGLFMAASRVYIKKMEKILYF